MPKRWKSAIFSQFGPFLSNLKTTFFEVNNQLSLDHFFEKRRLNSFKFGAKAYIFEGNFKKMLAF